MPNKMPNTQGATPKSKRKVEETLTVGNVKRKMNIFEYFKDPMLSQARRPPECPATVQSPG